MPEQGWDFPGRLIYITYLRIREALPLDAAVVAPAAATLLADI